MPETQSSRQETNANEDKIQRRRKDETKYKYNREEHNKISDAAPSCRLQKDSPRQQKEAHDTYTSQVITFFFCWKMKYTYLPWDWPILSTTILRRSLIFYEYKPVCFCYASLSTEHRCNHVAKISLSLHGVVCTLYGGMKFELCLGSLRTYFKLFVKD